MPALSIDPVTSFEIEGHGPLKCEWVGNTAHTTAYEITAPRGDAGGRVRLLLDVVLGEDLVPAFQLRSVRGTRDPGTVAEMVEGANSMAASEHGIAFALHGRIEMDRDRLRTTLKGLQDEIFRTDPGRKADVLAVQEKRLIDRMGKLDRLYASVNGWFEDRGKRSLDDALRSGGASDVAIPRIMGTRGIPGFIADATQERIRTLLTDPQAPAAYLGAMAVGDCGEIVDAVVGRAREEDIGRVHYISDGYDHEFGRGKVPFAWSLADIHPLITPSLSWMRRDGKIDSGDLLIVDCPEPRDFHLERVVGTLERLALDVPVLAFNRHFALMGRTGALRGHIAGLTTAAPEPADEPAGMTP